MGPMESSGSARGHREIKELGGVEREGGAKACRAERGLRSEGAACRARVKELGKRGKGGRSKGLSEGARGCGKGEARAEQGLR
eukprot:3407818-Rhodomonas_salina.1